MIYICYGVTKTASTFLYQLTEELLTTSGRTVCRMRLRAGGMHANYVDDITVPLLERIEKAAGNRDVVLKTHGLLHPGISDWIASGRAKASASIRDPREIALSLVDSGAEARKFGFLAFSEFTEPRDALHSIDVQLARFETWIAVPNVEVFTYNEVCFSTRGTIARLCRQIGIGADADKVLEPFRSGSLIGQINLARPRRYTAMDEATQQLFLTRYAGFYGKTDLGERFIGTAIPDIGKRHDRLSMMIDGARRFARRHLRTRNLGLMTAD